MRERILLMARYLGQRAEGFLPLTLPLLLIIGVLSQQWRLFPLIVFVVIPLLDRLIDSRNSNAGQQSVQVPSITTSYSTVLYTYVALHFSLMSLGLIQSQSLAWLDLFWLSLSVGLVSGAIGITVAHELGHRHSKGNRFLAGLLLTSVSYLHFLVEHNRGHHRRVATPADPATARLGETLYQFLPRTLFGSLVSAWDLECRRLKARKLPVLSRKNLVIWAVVLPPVVVFALLITLGPKAAAFFVIQSAIAILLLETVNYIEHYGLLRRQNSNGTYERVGPAHAWSSDRKVANLFLFNLLQHAHHHMDAGRVYQELDGVKGSPQLPAGYAELILTAWFPPLWRRRIHPRLPIQQKTPAFEI
ncbi:MAG: alkane 1-monooxygenase [Pseudomonadota bacterium]